MVDHDLDELERVCLRAMNDDLPVLSWEHAQELFAARVKPRVVLQLIEAARRAGVRAEALACAV